MSKHQSHQTDAAKQYDTSRLVVKGVRRTEADWDTYVAILLSHALHKAGVDDLLGEKGNGDD